MSGHGSFKTMGSYNPINTIHIGNVENIQQPNANPPPANIGGAEQQNDAPGTISPHELSKKLDVLLVQAERLSTKGIDAAALKSKVGEFGLGKSDLKALNKLIDNAAKKLNALDKFTGRQLADATVNSAGNDLNCMYGWNVKTPAGKAIKDAIDVVSKCILGIIKGGDGNFRSAEGIAQKVDAILANIAELRTAAKGNRAVIEAGKNMIVAMKGKGLPDGLFAKMAEAALKMKTGDVLKLSASASGLQFHRAIEKVTDNINYGMNTSGATKLLDGAEELEVARGFFAEIHFAKCSASTLNRMRDALNSDTASKLAKVYLSLSNGNINPGADLSEVHRDQVVYQSDVAMQMMNHLKTVVDIKCGVPENELTQLRIFNGNFDFEDVDAFEVREDLQTRASNNMERTRREFLENCVKGNGAGADVMRGIYGNKIGQEVGNPALDLKREMSKNSMTMIGWAIMAD